MVYVSTGETRLWERSTINIYKYNDIWEAFGSMSKFRSNSFRKNNFGCWLWASYSGLVTRITCSKSAYGTIILGASWSGGLIHFITALYFSCYKISNNSPTPISVPIWTLQWILDFSNWVHVQISLQFVPKK